MNYVCANIVFVFNIFLIHFLIISAKKYDVVMERTELLEYNPKYVEYWHVYTRRINRTSPYTFNLNGSLIYHMNNNITFKATAYEKVNAGYKLTPLQFSHGVCDWLRKDQLFVPIIRRASPPGTFDGCPLKGILLIKDCVVKYTDAPTGFWPFVNTRVDYDILATATNEPIIKFVIYIKVVEVPVKKISRRPG